jgi:hypothetical protein
VPGSEPNFWGNPVICASGPPQLVGPLHHFQLAFAVFVFIAFVFALGGLALLLFCIRKIAKRLKYRPSYYGDNPAAGPQISAANHNLSNFPSVSTLTARTHRRY